MCIFSSTFEFLATSRALGMTAVQNDKSQIPNYKSPVRGYSRLMRPVLMALIFATILSLATTAPGQTPAASGRTSAPQQAAPQQADLSQADLQKIIAREFGPGFSLLQGFPALQADLDGDGKQDLIIIGTTDDPMLDQAQFHYKVADPYNTFFGFGDPAVTSRFQADTGVRRMLLVMHDWQEPDGNPQSLPKSRRLEWKAKFVLVNVPFQTVEIGRVLINKKVVTAIKAQEPDGKSYVYWAGKKYKWQPGND
jgi:hypothetical protein